MQSGFEDDLLKRLFGTESVFGPAGEETCVVGDDVLEFVSGVHISRKRWRRSVLDETWLAIAKTDENCSKEQDMSL